MDSSKKVCKENSESINSYADLEKQYKELLEKENSLDEQIEHFEKQGLDSNLKPQMEALHVYNQTRDITQLVLGYLADIKQTTTAELHKQFNLPTTSD